MEKKQRIERICHGKAIRIFSACADRETVSFVESYRNCGNKSCTRCREKKARPHGPYWNLNYFDDAGKVRTIYVGKTLPDLARLPNKVSFADVLALFKQRDEYEEGAVRYRMRISRMKQEIEQLYEELRAAHRGKRKQVSGKSEKLFHQLARKYHPDRHSSASFSAEEVMKDINQLYQLLAGGSAQSTSTSRSS